MEDSYGRTVAELFKGRLNVGELADLQPTSAATPLV